jgi:tetratricopeptide (TPR) repeat protein
MGEPHAIPQQPAWRRAEVQVFDEVPEALALVLWQGIRHVRAWHQAPAPRRAELFHPHPRLSAESQLREARAAAPELRAALDGLLAVTRSPLTAAERDVAAACAEIARWAERNGHAQTAILFAEAAAVLDDWDPAFANHAGRLTRNAGEFARADLWFQRAIGLARGADASVEYTRAQLGYGRLWHTLGDVERARKHYNRGSVAAMRQGLEWLAAEAQHDLMAFLTEYGLFEAAELHARRALAWYPKRHHRFPLFVADLVYLFLRRSHYEAASRLARAAFRTARHPGQRLVIAAQYLRAKAGSGDAQYLSASRRRILRKLKTHSEYEIVVRIHLAEASSHAKLWDAAEEDARIALDRAIREEDDLPVSLARELLQRISGRIPPPGNQARTDHAFTMFVDAVSERIGTWRPTPTIESRSSVRRGWVA